MGHPRPENTSASLRWDDLEAFGAIADGVRAGQTLQQIGEHPLHPFGGTRMLYFRLSRLEAALGHRLVDRRRWGRNARLTPSGERLAESVRKLLELRRKIAEDFSAPDIPTFRVATNIAAMFTLITHATEVGKHPARPPALGFKPEFLTVDHFREVVAAVTDGKADLGLALVSPLETPQRLPASVRGEKLFDTEVFVLCSPAHPFAKRQGAHAAVDIRELAHERIIARPFFRPVLQPIEHRGEWIPVAHVGDVHGYVRLNYGVGLNTRIGYEVFGRQQHIVPLPIRPRVFFEWWTIRQRKRPPQHEAVRTFLEKFETFYAKFRKKR